MASINPATRYASPVGGVAKRKDSGKIDLGFTAKKSVDSKKGNSNYRNPKFTVGANISAEDLKKTASKGTGLGGLHKKFFNSKKEESTKKALTEVKANTRTLGMVLRSERELLSKSKELEDQVAELKLQLEEKSREVEKLKDLWLKQRGEIKTLKSAMQFPDAMNLQLQEMVEKQGCEFKQAKELFPSLQRQVTSLTGQLQCLTDDLAEVKAGTRSGRRFFGNQRTTSYEQEDGVDSPLKIFSPVQQLEQGDRYSTSPEDDMFVEDLNPCLTPYTMKPQFDAGRDSPW